MVQIENFFGGNTLWVGLKIMKIWNFLLIFEDFERARGFEFGQTESIVRNLLKKIELTVIHKIALFIHCRIMRKMLETKSNVLLTSSK